MSARTRFWLIMGAAVLLAVTAWGLAVPRLVQTNEDLAAELDELRDKVVAVRPEAVGGPTLEARDAARARVEARVEAAEARFATADAAGLDRWFDDVGLPWKSQPGPADFKRYYLLEVDALRRDLAGVYEAAGLGARTAPLIPHSWMGEDETPDTNALRGYQREFNVQDRVLRALAAVGVWLDAPVVIGAREPIGGVAAARLFDVIPVKAVGLVRPRDVRRGLHAFDETGERIGVRVRNVEIATPRPAEIAEGEVPPLRLVFELEVLDFKAEG